MSTAGSISTVAHFGIVLGQTPEPSFAAQVAAEFLANVDAAAMYGHRTNLEQLQARQEGAVTEAGAVGFGGQSSYFHSLMPFGAFAQWQGNGYGELFAIEGVTTRYIGDISTGSWAYFPPNLYFYYTVVRGISAQPAPNLTLHHLGAATYKCGA